MDFTFGYAGRGRRGDSFYGSRRGPTRTRDETGLLGIVGGRIRVCFSSRGGHEYLGLSVTFFSPIWMLLEGKKLCTSFNELTTKFSKKKS